MTKIWFLIRSAEEILDLIKFKSLIKLLISWFDLIKKLIKYKLSLYVNFDSIGRINWVQRLS